MSDGRPSLATSCAEALSDLRLVSGCLQRTTAAIGDSSPTAPTLLKLSSLFVTWASAAARCCPETGSCPCCPVVAHAVALTEDVRSGTAAAA